MNSGTRLQPSSDWHKQKALGLGTAPLRVGNKILDLPRPPVSITDEEKLVPLGTRKVPFLVRAFEVPIAALVLFITGPVVMVLAALVRLDTAGPALFFQWRMGLNRKNFRFVKLRTMYLDAKQRFPELYAYRYSDDELEQLKFKVENDPRVTPLGKWLRKSTLDELPNFWNVLTGEMALVGPRPEIPEMLPYYTGEMLLKFTVRPGITGPAQISGRGRLGFHETVALDVAYAKHHSFWLDLRIVFLTIYKIISRDGAF